MVAAEGQSENWKTEASKRKWCQHFSFPGFYFQLFMKVSIIITTCNRAEHLRQTLASLGQMHVPVELPTELLVVDNASTDDTAEVVKSCRLPNFPVRYFHEPKRGQSNARNSGMANTAGEVILFTDDDVRVPVDWVEKMAGPIFSDSVDALGGAVTIAPHLRRPWMQEMHLSALASTERFYDKSSERVFLGANMAFRRHVLARVPGFDPELGPGRLGFKDESLFAEQLKIAGFSIAKRLELPIEHHFEPSRLQRKSLLNTARKRGASSAYVDHHWHYRAHPHAIKEFVIAGARLFYYRARSLSDCLRQEGCAGREFSLVRKLWYWRQFMIERRRSRNYAYHGLAKRSSVESELDPKELITQTRSIG